MASDPTFRRARIVVFCFALVAMVFILLAGMFSNVTQIATLFLLIFFIGWVPATAVSEYAVRHRREKEPRYSSRLRIAVVVASIPVAAVITVSIVPLLPYPLTPAVTVSVMLLGFLPTSALAIVQCSRTIGASKN